LDRDKSKDLSLFLFDITMPMKTLSFTLLYFFLGPHLHAQTLSKMENELVKSYSQIENLNSDNKYEEVEKANTHFCNQLKGYLKLNPQTIKYPFNKLKATHVDISTSSDAQFKIYSWDTWTGGTMHFFENIFQYQSGSGISVLVDSTKTAGDTRPNYNNIYTLKANGKTYYLAVSLSIGSSKDVGQRLQIFAIQNGKLNHDVKLIKTISGMHSQLNIAFDFGSVVEWKIRPTIRYNSNTQTISLPLVGDKGIVTHKYINYKFTGQYFEKVKN
jgi:hypothetical protein